MQTQAKELQHEIQENTRKLKQIQQQRLRAEKEIIHCTRETEKRVELVMEKSGVVDVLQQLGHLLQEERLLSEQLGDQASAERDLTNELLERNERVTNKERSLSAEILEVKQCLAEAEARNVAAQALIHAASSDPKRSQSKLK